MSFCNGNPCGVSSVFNISLDRLFPVHPSCPVPKPSRYPAEVVESID